MEDRTIDGVQVSQRINGWWVSVRYDTGEEVHHGPYLTEDDAREEAALIRGEPLPSEVDSKQANADAP